jgi:hypothetical protein
MYDNNVSTPVSAFQKKMKEIIKINKYIMNNLQLPKYSINNRAIIGASIR